MIAVVGTICGFAALAYIYGGYTWIMCKTAQFFPEETFDPFQEWPTVTVLVTVHNEEAVIKERIHNLLETNYPLERLEIVIASDGSTDNTNSIVQSLSEKQVSLFLPKNRNGKTDTQNQAIKNITSEIIIFSDAKSLFNKDTLRQLVAPFSNRKVGYTTGKLEFRSLKDSMLADSQNRYWHQEMRLRAAESRLGLLAVGTGAIMAIRRNLFHAMPVHIGDDCILPLMAVRGSTLAVHAPNAWAADYIDDDITTALRSRIRMTQRNWQGTWAYPSLLNPFSHPGYAFSLWSHKLLRWLSPFFLTLWLASSVALLVTGSFLLLALPGSAFLVLAALTILPINTPGKQTVQSFLIANYGFAIGVINALLGKQIRAYNRGNTKN